MKKIFVPAAAFLLGVSVTAAISWKNKGDKKTAQQKTQYAAPNPDSRPIIALRKLKLKPGTSADAFENIAVKLAHNEYGTLPGVKEYIAKGERGDEIGSYIDVIEFDSKVTRDFYYPIPGSDTSKTSKEALRFLNSLDTSAGLQNMVDLVAAGKEGYTDYVVLK